VTFRFITVSLGSKPTFYLRRSMSPAPRTFHPFLKFIEGKNVNDTDKTKSNNEPNKERKREAGNPSSIARASVMPAPCPIYSRTQIAIEQDVQGPRNSCGPNAPYGISRLPIMTMDSVVLKAKELEMAGKFVLADAMRLWCGMIRASRCFLRSL